MTNAALAYLKAGFCPIPVHGLEAGERAKRPAINTWREFSTRLPTEAEVHGWWDNNPDWSIALVCGHGGLAVVDADTKEQFAFLLSEVGERYTKIIETRRGGHFWLVEEFPSHSGPLLDGIDVKGRSAGGQAGYVLVPPSPGYTFWKGTATIPLARVKNAREWAALRFGVSDKVNETKLYRQAMEGGEIPTGQRNATIASIGGKLLSSGMDTQFIPDVLRAINQTMAGEPLSDEEVRTTALSVSRYEDAHKPDDPGQPVSLSTLAGQEPPEQHWIVEDLVPHENTTVIAAQPGQYKTYLAMEMMYARQDGKFLDTFAASKGNSLFIDGENGMNTISQRIHQLRDDPAAYGDGMYFWYLDATVLDRLLTEKIVTLCKKLKCDVVFFDPYRQFMGGDEDKSGDTTSFTRQLTTLHKHGIAVVLIHHLRKSGSEQYAKQIPDMDEIRGSIALAGHARSVLTVKRSQSGVTMYQAKNNLSALREPFFINVDEGPRFSYGGETGESVDQAIDKEREVSDAIVELLSAGPKFRGDIIDSLRTTGGHGLLSNALKLLTQEGVITKQRVGRAVQYSLPERDQAQQAEEQPPASVEDEFGQMVGEVFSPQAVQESIRKAHE